MARISESTYDFSDVAFLPRPGDSAAIAKHTLRGGSTLRVDAEREIFLPVPVLEGHRFAVKDIAAGEELLSWGLPFGIASVAICIGTPLLNTNMYSALSGRVSVLQPGEVRGAADLSETISAVLHSVPVNFIDLDVSANRPFVIDPVKVGILGSNEERRNRDAAENISMSRGGIDSATFLGFKRADPNRGVGTRNHVLVLGLSSATAPLVQRMEFPLRNWPGLPNKHCDGVRVVAHTEGEAEIQNNLTFILRCVCGFVAHSNVGAAVIVYTGWERHLHPDSVRDFAKANGYSAACFEEPHLQFLCISDAHKGSFGNEEKAINEAIAKALATAS